MSVRVPRAYVVAGLALGSLAPGFPVRVRAQAPAVLKVATDPFDSYAEPYYAQDMGFFRAAGLDVEVISLTSGAAISLAVIGGEAPIGISNPIQLANAIAHGVPLTLIAGAGMYSSKSPNMLLCVAKSSPVSSARDLNGKTVAASALRDITQVGASLWLAKHGADVATIRFVEVPFSEMAAALQRGTVDAALIVEPALQAGLNDGEVRAIGAPFDAIAPQFLIGAWFSTKSFVQQNPELVKKFVATIYETARWANENQRASAAILGKYAKMSPETTSRMRRVLYAQTLTPRLIQPMLDVSYKSGILQKPVAAEQMIAVY